MKVLAMLSASLCVAGLAAPLRAESTVHLSETLEHKTASIVYPVECDEKAASVRVQVSVRVEDGEIAWTLVDPSGRTRLTGAGIAGRVSGDSGPLEPVIGRWEFRIVLDGFTGKIQIDGSSH